MERCLVARLQGKAVASDGAEEKGVVSHAAPRVLLPGFGCCPLGATPEHPHTHTNTDVRARAPQMHIYTPTHMRAYVLRTYIRTASTSKQTREQQAGGDPARRRPSAEQQGK